MFGLSKLRCISWFIIALVVLSVQQGFAQTDTSAYITNGSQGHLGLSIESKLSNLFSHDQPQDQQFLSLVHSRDRQLAVITGFRRLRDYHDGLKNRIDQALIVDDKFPRAPEKVIAAIETEMQRVAKFESDFKGASDNVVKNKLAEEFDLRYPLFNNSAGDLQNSLSVFSGLNADQYRRVSGAASAVSFSRTERQTAAEVFQNISSEDGRELLARYDGIFHKIEQYTSVVSRGPKLPALESLPTSFNELSGGRAATSWLTLSDNQIQSGIDKYKAALQLAKEQSSDVIPDSVGKQLKRFSLSLTKLETI